MLISHMSEDNETNFYVPSAGTLVLKGLRSTPKHPDMVFKGLNKFKELLGSKNGKNSFLTFCLNKLTRYMRTHSLYSFAL